MEWLGEMFKALLLFAIAGFAGLTGFAILIILLLFDMATNEAIIISVLSAAIFMLMIPLMAVISERMSSARYHMRSAIRIQAMPPNRPLSETCDLQFAPVKSLEVDAERQQQQWEADAWRNYYTGRRAHPPTRQA